MHNTKRIVENAFAVYRKEFKYLYAWLVTVSRYFNQEMCDTNSCVHCLVIRIISSQNETTLNGILSDVPCC